MISIKTHIENELKKEPFLLENINNGLINISSLARKIEPKISELVGRKINTNAIVMSIKRMEIQEINKTRILKKQLRKIGDITVRSGLIDYNFNNSAEFEKLKSKFNISLLTNTKGFHTLSKGINETTIIISENLKAIFEKKLKDIPYRTKTENLASITIELPKENTQTTGLYYSLLGIIAYKGINLIEVISTTNELTIILKEQQVSTALETLMSLKKSKS
ncbi:MAG: aspartate kinase [Crocinitomicaceae bacterium]|nr:aspartate kinase [Crocinitomicaceae bacterium]|tara:strand:- start:2894 stop:3556 length:663 start_codon:yes stop_codon:yes gene_type:complete